MSSLKTKIEFERIGYLAVMGANAANLFMANSSSYTQGWGRNKGKGRYVSKKMPFFMSVGNQLAVGYGAILTLREKNPLYEFVEIKSNIVQKRPLDYYPIPGLVQRWHQEEAFDLMRLKEGGGIELPVAAGKTELEIILAYSGSKSGNVLFIGPTHTILGNFIRRCEKYGIEIIDYSSTRDRSLPSTGHIIVANPISVQNDVEQGNNTTNLSNVSLLISDEGHHLQATTWNFLMYALPQLERSYGFSGTLVNNKEFSFFGQISVDEAYVYSMTGPVIYSKTPVELKEFIDRPNVINVPFTWPDGPFLIENNWTNIRKKRDECTARNSLILAIIRRMDSLGRSTITPVDTLDHGISILQGYGIPNAICWFGGNTIVRQDGTKLSENEVRSGIDDGSIRHLIVTSHADEGLDIPDLSTSILSTGSGGRRTKQRSGRIARPGDKAPVVINIFDQEQGILNKHARDRSSDITNYYETEAWTAESLEHLQAQIGLIESRHDKSD